MYLHIFCVRLLHVCSFNEDGQYQSLRLWNEQQVWLSRFSFFILNHFSVESQGKKLIMKRITFFLLLLESLFVVNGANFDSPKKYEIWSGTDFINLVSDPTLNNCSFEGDTILFKSDIDLKDYCASINFNGVLYGNGFSIINQTGPLFNSINEKGIIKDLIWKEGCTISETGQGIVAKSCSGVIANCSTYASFRMTSLKDKDIIVGGFCAYLQHGIIYNCHNFYPCTTGTYDKNLNITVGGICAESIGGSIINCSNEAKLRHYPNAKLIAGGIVGNAINTNIVNCSNNELVLCNIEDITSLLSTQINIKIGGICGIARNCEFNHCLNNYLLQTNTGHIAGIVAIAQNCDIINCINRGKINNIDSYFYSNSAGIVCNLTNEETRECLNCANFGEVISYTKNAIAVGAGIATHISNATIGMCANFANVDVMARGTQSSTFKYNDYDSENCKIIENSSDFQTWNNFIDANYKYKLSHWDLKDENSPSLSTPLWFCARAFPNCTQISVSIFPANPELRYNVELMDSTECRLQNNNNISDLTTFSNLHPNEKYAIKITNDSYKQINSFFTKTGMPELKLDFCEYGYEDCEYSINYKFKGIAEQKIVIDIEGGGKSFRITPNTFKSKLEQLVENTKYVALPSAYIRVGNELKQFIFSPIEFYTLEFIPNIEVSPEASEAKVSCENFLNLKDRSIGFKFNDSTYVFNSNKSILIDDLAYQTNYNITPVILRGKSTGEYPSIDFTTKLEAFFSPISMSSHGAIICGTTLAGEEVPGHRDFYHEFIVEYRNISSNSDTRSKEEKCYIIDNRKLSAVYIPFDTDDIIQYRFISHWTGRDYYHNWYVLDRRNAFDSTVVPHFFNCRYVEGSNNNSIQCTPIRGDEEIIEWGIAYKFEDYSDYTETKLTLGSGEIRLIDNFFVPSLTYHIKFYGKTEDKTYYSQTYSLENHVLSAMVDNSTGSASLENVYVDTFSPEIDYTAPYEVYNLSGRFLGDSCSRLLPGIYIVRQGRIATKVVVR